MPVTKFSGGGVKILARLKTMKMKMNKNNKNNKEGQSKNE